MTNSWNQFTVGKVDTKDSTVAPAAAPGTGLNLTDLAPHGTKTVSNAGGGSVLDAVPGFASGLGTQALGTYTSLFGIDSAQINKNISAGGSGSAAEGHGFIPAIGKLYDGLSSTVGLAIHNPDALLRIPGQLVNNFTTGDWKTRGDMMGQATFIAGTFVVGGAGASKAGAVAGDLREASVVAKGADALAETGSTVRSLETTVQGLRSATSIGTDASAMTKFTSITEGAGSAGIVAKTTGALDQSATSLIGGTGRWADRVTLQSEAPTSFLTKASSVGVQDNALSLPNRLWQGLRGTDTEASAFSRFASNLKPSFRATEPLGNVVVDSSSQMLNGGKVADATQAAKNFGTLGHDLSGASILKPEYTVRSLDQIAPHMDAVTREANILKTSMTDASHVNQAFVDIEKSISNLKTATTAVDQAEHLSTLNRSLSLLEKQGGLDAQATQALRQSIADLHLQFDALNVSPLRAAESAVQITDHTATLKTQTSEMTAKFGDQLPQSVREFNAATTKFTEATNATERAQAFANLEKASTNVVREFPSQAGGVARTVDALKSPVQYAARFETGGQTAIAQLSEKTSALTSRTAELSAKYGTNSAVQELEVATSKFSQATSAAEKAQAYRSVETATAKVANELPAADVSKLQSSVEALRTPVQIAAKSEATQVVATQIAERSTTLTSNTAELTAKFGEKAVQELNAATREFAQATTATEKARAFQSVEQATAKVVKDFPAADVANLQSSVEALRAPVQIANRIESAQIIATQVAERTPALTSHSAELMTKFGDNGSVQELNAATKQFSQATTAAEKANAFQSIESATAKVVRELPPDAVTQLQVSVDALRTPVQMAVKAEAGQVAAVQVADRTSLLTSHTAELTANFGEHVPASVKDLEMATAKFSKAGTATEQAQAFAAVERASAKVATEFPAEAANVTRTVDSLRAPLQVTARLEQSEVAATQIAEHTSTLTSQTSQLTAKLKDAGSVRELETATTKFAQATTASEKAQAFAAVEKASAKVATEFPAETANLTRTVETLRSPVQLAAKLEQTDVAAAQIAGRTEALTAHTADLTAQFGEKVPTSVRELGNATTRFSEATTATEKAQAFASVERASAKVAAEFPAESANITHTVEALRSPVQFAAKVEQTEIATAQIASRTEALTAHTAEFAASFGEKVPTTVRELEAANTKFSQATTAVEKADAFAAVEKASANVAREFPAQSTQLARTVDSLAAPVETAARAQRLENAVVQIDEHTSTLVSNTTALREQVAVGGNVPASVRELDVATTRMSEATTTAEKAQAFQAVQKSAAQVAAEFPTETAPLTRTIESLSSNVQTADRLTQIENATTKLAAHTDQVAQEATLLKSVVKTPQAETAISDLQTGINNFKGAATTADRTEQISQINRNLHVVEAEVGQERVAALKTSIARMENEVGTIDRVSLVDRSTVQTSGQAESVVRQVNALKELASENNAVQTALKNIQQGATESGTVNALNRTEQLSARGADIGVIERELGTKAAGEIRTAIAELDRSTAATRTATVELVDYQGAKIAQQVNYLQEGRLGSTVQSERIQQLQHDVAVMKSVVPTDSPMASHIAKLEALVSDVSAYSNILSHSDVARASGRELLKLAKSTDESTANAAAQKLKFMETRADGLVTEHQRFLNSQKLLGRLEESVRTKLYESGRLFGLPSGEPIFRKTLSDLSLAIFGLGTLDGNMAYNLSQLSAKARDNVLSAEAAAKQKDAEHKKDVDAQKTGNGNQQAGQPQSSGQASQSNQTSSAPANNQSVQRSDAPDAKLSKDTQSGNNSYVRADYQTTFKNDNDARVSPALAVYGNAKFMPADSTNNIPAGSFPSSGSSWWWKQQHGGNVWGFSRGPGYVAPPQEVTRTGDQVIARARGMSQSPEGDLTKIAQARFPIPRIIDLTNQNSLLDTGTTQFGPRRQVSAVGMGSGTAKNWASVDMSQFGGGVVRTGATEGRGGHDLRNLGEVEKESELGMDAPGSGSASGGAVVLNSAGGTNVDPSIVDPSQGSTVVASNSQSQDEENKVGSLQSKV